MSERFLVASPSLWDRLGCRLGGHREAMKVEGPERGLRWCHRCGVDLSPVAVTLIGIEQGALMRSVDRVERSNIGGAGSFRAFLAAKTAHMDDLEFEQVAAHARSQFGQGIP